MTTQKLENSPKLKAIAGVATWKGFIQQMFQRPSIIGDFGNKNKKKLAKMLVYDFE